MMKFIDNQKLEKIDMLLDGKGNDNSLQKQKKRFLKIFAVELYPTMTYDSLLTDKEICFAENETSDIAKKCRL